MGKKRSGGSRLRDVLGLMAALVLSFFIVVAADVGPVPTLQFYCMNFNLMENGSVQALVEVRIKNLPYCRGTDFNLQYNDAYLIPSKHENNEAYGEGASLNTRDFFAVDPALYGGKAPFVGTSGSGNPGEMGNIDRQNKQLTLNLALDQVKIQTELNPGGQTGGVALSEPDRKNRMVAYLPGANTQQGVKLGEISFWVPPDKITEMVQKYSKPGAGEELLKAVSAGGDSKKVAWELLYCVEERGNYKDDAYDSQSPPTSAQVEYIFEFPDTLVNAALPVDFVRLNAWEAYAGGDWSDVAAALQRCAGQIELTYANGDRKREVFPWGKANTGDGAPQSDYAIYTTNASWSTADDLRALPDTAWTQVSADSGPYSARSGVYKVQQYYLYTEKDREGKEVAKRYPLPRTAYLVIDPVTLTGAWARDLDKTYSAANVPGDFAGLGLPVEAILQTSPTLNKVSLLLPIQDWTPNALPETWTKLELAPVYADGQTLNAAAITRYPWLTLGSAALTATRSVVTEGTQAPADPANYTFTIARKADTVSAHDLLLTVRKQGENGTPADLPAGSDIQVYLPNGVEALPAWFTQAGYQEVRVETDAVGHYQIEMDPDQGNGYAEELKTLRRYTNLGGWFAVTVTEPGTAATGKLYAYLTPRENRHTASYAGGQAPDKGAFDFTGSYAGLLPMYAAATDLTTGAATVEPFGPVVTLPLGYHVETTYDGVTGDDGGKLGVVKVGQWTASGGVGEAVPSQSPWTVNPGQTLTAAHGADPFLDGGIYDGYGRVSNADGHQVQIKTEFRNPAADSGEVPEKKPDETGSLEIWENGTKIDGVVYNTRQQGYVVREERTLTLKNTGSTDVSGIYLDLDHAPYRDEARGHYELLRAPAAYLPAGGETTFVITYVYDLRFDLDGPNVTGTTYQDTIAVGTNYTQAAATFTARFRVTRGPVSTVKVVTIPDGSAAAGSMGTAGLIMGLPEGKPAPGDVAEKPSSAPGVSDYEAGYQYVWIQANPVDEYRVRQVYYEEGGQQIALTAYPYSGTDGEGTYYYFAMPSHDTTVYVQFEEPVSSKLRLSSLLVYGGADGNALIDDRDAEANLQILRVDDRASNAPVTYPRTFQEPGKLHLTNEESAQPKFFAVLPYDAAHTQISLSLRQVMAALDRGGQVFNHPLDPIQVRITTPVSDKPDDGELELCNEANGMNGTWKPADGSSVTQSSVHRTSVFDSPAPGGEKRITITLTYGTESRSFTVRLIRLKEGGLTPELGYGNSPFGMIMNDGMITDKAAAKAAFQAGNKFVDYIPAKAAGLTNVYWAETYDAVTGAPVSPWKEGENYDQNDEALFVLLGQGFRDPGVRSVLKDSAGNPVDLSGVTLSIEDKTTTVVTLTEKLDVAAGQGVAAGWEGMTGIRPGVYTMKYSFTDYDGAPSFFTRPLVVLPQVGDVNLDGMVDDKDEQGIENRVTAPLADTDKAWPWAELFRLRACDTNNDRLINNIDANFIRAGKLAAYYLPIDYK